MKGLNIQIAAQIIPDSLLARRISSFLLVFRSGILSKRHRVLRLNPLNHYVALVCPFVNER